MEVTLLGMTTLVSELHPENAESPMEVTLLGMTMLVSDLQLLKVLFPMEVTGSLLIEEGIVKFPALPVYATICIRLPQATY